jgi:hypothetical protein
MAELALKPPKMPHLSAAHKRAAKSELVSMAVNAGYALEDGGGAALDTMAAALDAMTPADKLDLLRTLANHAAVQYARYEAVRPHQAPLKILEGVLLGIEYAALASCLDHFTEG